MKNLFACIISIFLASCSSPSNIPKNLVGTWVSHHKAGFDFIEFTSDNDIEVKRFFDPEKLDEGNHSIQPIWYYQGKAKIQFLDSNHFYLNTDKYQLEFKLLDGNLVEFDPQGKQGSFIKVQ